jgi:hypothetical protein
LRAQARTWIHGVHKRGYRGLSNLSEIPINHWIGQRRAEFNPWSVRRRSVERTVETLHQEVLKLRQPLDRPETAQGLNPRRQSEVPKESSYQKIRIQRIRNPEDKCVSAFETAKSRKRSGIIGLVDDHSR